MENNNEDQTQNNTHPNCDDIEILIKSIHKIQADIQEAGKDSIEEPLQEEQHEARRAVLLQQRQEQFSRLGRTVFSLHRQGAILILPSREEDAETEEVAPLSAPSPALPEPELPEQARAEADIAPPRDERPAPAPTPIRVDPAVLQGAMGPSWLAARQSTPRPPRADGDIDLDAAALVALIRGLEPPEAVAATAEAVGAELERLRRASEERTLQAWPGQPRRAQQAMIGLIATRARHLQDEHSALVTDQDALNSIFSALTSYSKHEQPGFVHGLMRSHQPERGTWWLDAVEWWRKLRQQLPDPRILNPERALSALEEQIDAHADDEALAKAIILVLDAGVSVEDPRLLRLSARAEGALQLRARFKHLRRTLRDWLDAEKKDAEEGPEGAIPEDWAWADYIRGRRACLVGGDLREEARRRIQGAFGAASLEWVTVDHFRNIQSLAEAIQNGGGPDLVIILRRFIGHSIDQVLIPACRSSEVPWVSVEHGYGVNQIRNTIEHYLPPASPAADAQEPEAPAAR